MKLHALAAGSAFRAPMSGLTGRVLRVSPGGVSVEIDRDRVKVIHPAEGEPVVFRAKERVTWSGGTEVDPL